MIPQRVSIILTCYNYAQYLRECVESVLAQSYSNWELIIVDDESTDDSPEIARELSQEHPEKITYLRIKNSGVSRARNIGIENTQGEFILPLDADDFLYPDAIENLVRAINKDRLAGYAYGGLTFLNALPGEPTEWQPGPFSADIMTNNNLSPISSLWRRTLFEKGVRYEDDFIYEDWDLWLQILAAGNYGAYTPHYVMQHRMHPYGRTTSFAKNLVFQGKAQQAEHLPSLYPQEEYKRFCKNMLANAPESFKKPTIFFLCPMGEARSREVEKKIIELGLKFSEQKHTVLLWGDLTMQELPAPLHAMNIQGEYKFDLLQELFESFGPNLILFNYWKDEMLQRIKDIPTLNLLVDIGEHPSRYATHRVHLKERVTLFETGMELFTEPTHFLSYDSFCSSICTIAENRFAKEKERVASERKLLLKLVRATDFHSQKGMTEEETPTIIIPTRNIDIVRLKRCIESFRKSKSTEQTPIIISDYGSTEPFLSQIKSLSAEYNLTLVASPIRGPWSRSRALNIGARNANTPWLMFTDADMIFSENFLKMWLEYKRNLKGNRYYLAQCIKLPPTIHYKETWSPSDFKAVARQGRVYGTFGHGGLQLIPKDVFAQIRGFNEEYHTWGVEDLDLSHRLSQAGCQQTWLQPGYLLHQWHLKNVNESKAKRNREIWSDYIERWTISPVNRESWGKVSTEERMEYERVGPLPYTTSEYESIQDKILEAGRSSDTECAGELLLYAQRCFEEDKYESIIETLDDAYTLLPQDPMLLYLKAVLAIRRDAFQEAAHICYELLEMRLDDYTHIYDLLKNISLRTRAHYRDALIGAKSSEVRAT